MTKPIQSPPLPTNMPPALRSFGHLLQDMPETHFRAVCDLFAQLNPLLSESFQQQQQGFGEFNGYDGMDLKGEVERLLPSEWLWQELNSDEFLRRFSENELLYHKPAFETPTDKRTHLIVIDCGPEMIGRPRLIALAALLNLNALAKANGSRVLWTAPNATIMEWKPLLTQEDLKSFLASPSPLSLNEINIEELLSQLPDHSNSKDSLFWNITAKPQLFKNDDVKYNQMIVTETMSLDQGRSPKAEANITLNSYTGITKKQTLDYPEEDICASLLREPFKPKTEHTHKKTDDQDPKQVAGKWVPRYVRLVPEHNKLMISTDIGVLIAGIDHYPRKVSGQYFIEIDEDSALLGIDFRGPNKIALLTLETVNSSPSVHLKIFDLNTSPMEPLTEEDYTSLTDQHAKIFAHSQETYSLKEKHKLLKNKFMKRDLPPLIKPGKKFRYLAFSSTGEQFEINHGKIKPHSQLSYIPLFAYKDEWAYVSLKANDKQYLVARNLKTMRVVSFPVSEEVQIKTSNDFFHIGDINSHTIDPTLVRCEDGYWRGGKNLPTGGQVDQITLDLPKGAIPLGSYRKQKGIAPYPAYRMTFWNPIENNIFYCGFTLADRADIEILTVLDEKYAQFLWHNNSAIGVKLNEQNYPEWLDVLPLEQDEIKPTRTYIDDMFEDAVCLTD